MVCSVPDDAAVFECRFHSGETMKWDRQKMP
jgi:hypothetical protein